MSPDSEGLLVIVVFLLPGFVANWLSEYFSRSAARRLTAFESTLQALAVSLLVLYAQAVLASAALTVLWFFFRGVFDDLLLNVLVKDGLREYFSQRALLVASVAAGSITISFAVSIVAGYKDLLGGLLRRLLARRGLYDHDHWYFAFNEFCQVGDSKSAIPDGAAGLSRDNVKTSVYVEAVMKSRDVIRGFVRGYSFRSQDSSDRDLILGKATYLRYDGSGKLENPQYSERVFAVLNSKDIESLRVVYLEE